MPSLPVAVKWTLFSDSKLLKTDSDNHKHIEDRQKSPFFKKLKSSASPLLSLIPEEPLLLCHQLTLNEAPFYQMRRRRKRTKRKKNSGGAITLPSTHSKNEEEEKEDDKMQCIQSLGQ